MSLLARVAVRLRQAVPLLAAVTAACAVAGAAEQTNDEPRGLVLRLSDGKEAVPAGAAPAAPPAATTPLTAARTRALLRRLPALPRGDRPSAAFAASTAPPPRTGKTVREPFPPAAAVPSASPRSAAPIPLRITRRSPEGPVPALRRLTIAFSQPMVPLGPREPLALGDVPARLVPQPRGQWRWVDPQILAFEAEGSFPMATQYTAEVPGGTRSALGGVLARTERWSFETPAPTVVGHYPEDGPTHPDVLLFAAFDQKVDPEAVLPTVRVRTGDRALAVRLAVPAEIEADGTVRRRLAEYGTDRVLVFRTVDRLPYDSEVTVSIGKGTVSAEGPRAMDADHDWSFRTAGPLRVVGHRCYGACPPGSVWTIQFSNPLDAEALDTRSVRIVPEPSVSRITAWGKGLTVAPAARASTTYTVELPAGLRDVFGGTLAQPVRVSFDVGPAVPPPPRLSIRGGPFVTLLRTAEPRVAIQSQGIGRLRVDLQAVRPEDWPAARGWKKGQVLPGRLVASRVVPIDEPDRLTDTPIELAEALAQPEGYVLLIAEGLGLERSPGSPAPVYAWVQQTGVGLEAFADARRLTVSATALADGRPLDGVELQLVPTGTTARTGPDGMAAIDLTDAPSYILVARHAAESAVLPADLGYAWGPAWKRGPTEALRWYVFDAQGLYRPGEVLKAKGWLRREDLGPGGGITVPANVTHVRYTLEDDGGNGIGEGEARLNAWGGFNLALPLPTEMNLGPASLGMQAVGWSGEGAIHTHESVVLEFRRPDFEIKASAAAGPHFVGDAATVSAAASYYAGGALRDTPVTWEVETRRSVYEPPGHRGFVFGPSTPPWLDESDEEPSSPNRRHEGRTDAHGTHVLRLDFESMDPSAPMRVRAVASVEDVDREAWTAGADLLVHPAEVYVGVRTDRHFVRKGGSVRVDTIVTALDGAVVAGRPVSVRLERLVWSERGGRGQEEVVERLDCDVTSTTEPLPCTFPLHSDGELRVTATVTDERGRRSQSTTRVWAGGGPARRPAQPVPGWPSSARLWARTRSGRPGATSALKLIADRAEYSPGDTVELLVVAPMKAADGLLTLRRGGLARTERFRLAGGTHTLRFQIEEGWVPNVHAHVALVSTGPDTAAAFALRRELTASVNVRVSAEGRRLHLSMGPRRAALAPGETTTLEGRITDAQGRPVASSEVAVTVVDDALVALLQTAGEENGEARAGLPLRDPLVAFTGERPDGVTRQGLRGTVLRWPPAATSRARPGAGIATGSIQHDPVGCLVAGEFSLVAAEIFPGASVARARVYFKAFNSDNWHFVDMTPAGRGLVAKLPRAPVEVGAVRYYIQAFTTDFGEDQTPELEAIVVETAAECPPGQSVAEFGPPGEVTVFSVATGRAVIAPVGFAAAGGIGDAIPMRKDFRALALFAASAVTDTDGRVTIRLTLPDSLTRYRILAVAAGGDRFGRGESSLTASLPLTIRPSTPRFLSVGDQFELAAVVQNQTAAALDVDVAARAQGASLAGPAGRRVTVPAGDRVEVRFAARVERPGEARIQLAAASGTRVDAAEVALPVWTPVSGEAFATHGEIDDGGAVSHPVAAPVGVLEDYGGLEITTSSTALHALTDAFLYLKEYPYECSEQISSRLMGVAALKDVLAAFAAKDLPPPEEIAAAARRDLERLRQMQNEDGSFGFWSPGERRWPYLGIHAAHALALARDAGFDVSDDMLSRSEAYLRGIEQHLGFVTGPSARDTLRAYALAVRHRLDDSDPKAARAVVGDSAPGVLSLEALGWLLPTLAAHPASKPAADFVRRELSNRVAETASTAHFTDSYGDDGYLLLHSDRRADAIVLDALLATEPGHPLASKLVEGLLGSRRAGRWSNTQENAFVLLALERYFSVRESTTPAFVATAWLGSSTVGAHRFAGRTADRHVTEVPMRLLLAGAAGADLTLAKQGQGRLYYRLGLRYAPADPLVSPLYAGFAVTRSYEATEAPDDVRREPDGTWVLRPGARVRIRITMAAPEDRHHVALVDALPAGLEPLDPEIAISGGRVTSAVEGDEDGWWPWFDHQNVRDERVEAFTAHLHAGVYTYTYLARATTLGDFVAPAPRAEEMYHPETFGRGGTDRVRVGR